MELQLREKEIFEALKKIQSNEFVLIGGYAVNAYTLPRFSTDCDIVVKQDEETQKITETLAEKGYTKTQNIPEMHYGGKFTRLEKQIKPNFSVSMDILAKEVLDRQTQTSFTAEWVFSNSSIKELKGKTITEKIKLRIISADALFVMKFLSCRQTDIRDIFLLIEHLKNNYWIKQEINKRYSFNERLDKITKEISSPRFKNGLQGVFGLIDNKMFDKNKEKIINLQNNT